MIVYALGIITIMVFILILIIAALLIIAMEGMVFTDPNEEATTTRLQAVSRTIRAVTDRIRVVDTND
jgi:regulator of protease activity HflC (stomatin/prohibitin superfamily)